MPEQICFGMSACQMGYSGRGKMKNLFKGADFIGQTDNQGFAGMGNSPESERPHMCTDDSGFKRIDAEIAQGIVHGDFRMPETMQ